MCRVTDEFGGSTAFPNDVLKHVDKLFLSLHGEGIADGGFRTNAQLCNHCSIIDGRCIRAECICGNCFISPGNVESRIGGLEQVPQKLSSGHRATLGHHLECLLDNLDRLPSKMRMMFFTIRLCFLHSTGMLDVSNSFRGVCSMKCHLWSLHSIMKRLPMDTWCFRFMGITEEIMVVCSVTSLASLTALAKMVKGIVERILLHSINMIEPVFFCFQIKIENRWIPFPGTCHDNVRKRVPFTILERMHVNMCERPWQTLSGMQRPSGVLIRCSPPVRKGFSLTLSLCHSI